MLDLCSHHDQAALHEELEARLARDFLTLLPPEIAVMILSYLPVKGLITGMQVCKSWREVISGAAPLWRKAVNEIGLSNAIVKTHLPECGSYMELIFRALRHKKCISSYITERRMEKLASETLFSSAGCYITFEDYSSSTSTLKQMYNDGSLVTLHTFNCPSNLRVVFGPFAPINNRDFVFWGNHRTGWIGWCSTDPPSSLHPPPCKVPRTDAEDVSDLAGIVTDSGLQIWSTNDVEHCYFENTSACPNCGLIALFCLHASSRGLSSVLFRKLTPGVLTVNEIGKCTVQLPKQLTPDPNNIDCFNMILFPKDCDQGLCGCHYLLVDYEPEHLSSLHLVPAEISCVSELPTITLPEELANWTGNLFVDLHFSTDGSVVAFLDRGLNEEQYCVWEPGSGRVVSVCLPPNLRCPTWVATGKLYSILGGVSESKKVFAVIGTYTGEILLYDVYDYSMFPPVDQSWLSTFDVPEHLPIAIEFQTLYTVSSIGSIIARRSV